MEFDESLKNIFSLIKQMSYLLEVAFPITSPTLK